MLPLITRKERPKIQPGDAQAGALTSTHVFIGRSLANIHNSFTNEHVNKSAHGS